MKRIMIIFLKIMLGIQCYGQEGNVIQKLEIYAVDFFSLYITNINKTDLKKEYGIYVKVIDKDEIRNSNIKYLLTGLEKDESSQLPDDYRAILIVHYKSEKKTYYIASNSWGIVYDNHVFKVNYSLLAAIYSFLPNRYFKETYDTNKIYFDNTNQ